MSKSLTILFLLLSHGLFSREIIIMDAESEEVISGALVRIFDSENKFISKFKSDSEGKVDINISSNQKLRVFAVGFKEEFSSINSRGQVKLQKLNFLSDELIVTSSFIPSSRDNSVYNYSVISQKNLEKNSSHNMRDIISKSSAFSVSNRSSMGSSLTLNGLSGNHVMILLDGVPIQGKLNGNIDLSQISTSNIKQIEIIEGPSSSVYGSGAFGGVVNLISNTANIDKYSASIDSYIGSDGKYLMSGNGYFKNDYFGLNITLGRNFIDGWDKINTSREKQWDPQTQYFGRANLRIPLSNFNLIFNANSFDEKLTDKGALRYPYFVSAFDTYTFTKRRSYDAKLSGLIGGKYFFNFLASLGTYSRARNKYFKDMVSLNQTLTGEGSDTTILDNVKVQSRINIPFAGDKFESIIALDYENESIESSRIRGGNEQNNSASLATILNINYFDKLTLSPSIRLQYDENFGKKIIPAFNGIYSSGDYSLKTSLASGFRSPDLKERYLEFRIDNINLFGNENLIPEDAIHFSSEFGIKFNNNNINKINTHLKFGVFFNEISNYIATVNTGGNDWQYQNINRYSTAGVKFSLNLQYKNFKFTTSPVILGRNTFLKENQRYNLSPEIYSTASYSFLDEKASLDISHKYSGEINSFYQNGKEIEESYLGAYSIVELSMSYKFWDDKVSLNGGIKNLFDKSEAQLSGKILGYSSSKGADKLSIDYGRSFYFNLRIIL
jgi:outer membrane receptor for ferrienterochelin and colicins